MKIFVLMGQRNESYVGEYAPEALACMDEYGDSENPDFLREAKVRADESGEFESTTILPLEVDSNEVMGRLRPQGVPVNATIVG